MFLMLHCAFEKQNFPFVVFHLSSPKRTESLLLEIATGAGVKLDWDFETLKQCFDHVKLI